MQSTEERILHYQRGIDRSVEVLDKSRLLHCIKALSKLPVTMEHLKNTGIGRTVNSLRKIEDGVGDASKRLVIKWKNMVTNTPESGESDEACVPDDPDNHDRENNSPRDNDVVHDNNISDGHNGFSRPEALERPVLSPPMVIDVNVSPQEPAPKFSDNEEEVEETNCKQSSKDSNSKESRKDSKSDTSSHRHSGSKDKRESSKSSKNPKDSGHEEHKKKDRNKSKSESSSSKEKKHSSSEVMKRKVESSDDESNSKKQRLSACENESDNNDNRDKSNNFVIDNDGEEESLSNEPDSKVTKVESLKDRHKESSLKHSDNKSSSSKSKEKRSGSSSSRKTKSYESLKKNKKERKHKSKSPHNSSSSNKDTNGKHGSSKDDKSKNEDEKSKSKDKKSKENDKKKSKTAVDGSIDSMSGTSFADALGMCSMPPPKKKKESSSFKPSSKADSSSSSSSSSSSPQPQPQPSAPNKPSPSKSKTEYKPTSPSPDSPEDSLSLLSPNVKLEPLSGDLNEEVDLASTLPEPSPFYKPLPQINHVQRRFDEEQMLSQVINAKVQRTKVYSGNKSGWTSVPSLQEICIRVLIENIDALEYTGGVPFDILKPILERATADQLFVLEYHNPYLIEESDLLWKFHCNKYFKSKQREEMESWREMYMRCLTEREAKFKAITANIKQSIDKSTPVRSTKLAYVDHFVKPPRNVLRQQAKYGTAKVTTSASDLKKKLITGVVGPSSSSSSNSSSSSSSSSSSISSSNVERISVPPPPPARSRAASSHPIKKTKAPLMAKALQAIKGRYKR